jgi:hypothetical protein
MSTRDHANPPAPAGRPLGLGRRYLGGGLLVLALSAVAWPPGLHAAGATRAAPAPKLILSFQTMIGDSGPYVGAGDEFRGIPAGGAPWKIAAASGQLNKKGRLIIVVHGLTLLNGTNPVPHFEGAVSCQSINASGQAIVVNVFTPAFAATSTGNSRIAATVTLPTPCFAPLIFVTSPAPQSWFATTGA